MHNPPHPGVVLDEGWITEDFPVGEAARQIGIDPESLRSVIDGRGNITPQLAARLEAAGWLNAPLWLRLQASYDAAQKRLRLGHQAA